MRIEKSIQTIQIIARFIAPPGNSLARKGWEPGDRMAKRGFVCRSSGFPYFAHRHPIKMDMKSQYALFSGYGRNMSISSVLTQFGAIYDKWQGAYDSGWQGDIVPESFSHPAKFSRRLIHRIYKHAKEMGWVEKGSWVLDPFGGVALGGLDAMSMGLNWIGVELEEKFVKLGEQNIELWNRKLKGWPNLGTARMINGDSRNLKAVIEGADIVVSSPPYSTDVIRSRDIGKSNQGATQGKHSCDEYGHTPGNLANMKEGKFEMVVGSPPYAESLNAKEDGIDWSKCSDGKGGKRDFTVEPGQGIRKKMAKEYGQFPGQLGSMKEGSFDISKVNMGNSLLATDTFWSACREIVQQCYELLKPGGHAIWVTKNYVKAKKIVPFSDRWLTLCESVGFKLVCRHQAMLVKVHGQQECIDGECEEISTERKSFFRRLAESKGSPRIDHEDVICVEK